MTALFFKGSEHQKRFLDALHRLQVIDKGRADPEYAAALYVLTADLATWRKAGGYVGADGIDIPALLEEIHFSSGYAVLLQWAANLFNGQTHIDPVELMRLDESNFKVALTALQLRRYGLSVG